MRAYNTIKSLVKEAKNETLKEMYLELQNSELCTEDIAVMTAIETELETRGVIKLNEESFEYEFIA